MANTLFRIRIASGTGTPAEPPFDAWPLVEAPPVVVWPVARSRNGEGSPNQIYGLPYAVVGRNQIQPEGLAYWAALFPAPTTGSAVVKVNLYDTRTQAWGVYQGILSRPTVDQPARGGYKFLNFRALISELVSSSW